LFTWERTTFRWSDYSGELLLKPEIESVNPSRDHKEVSDLIESQKQQIDEEPWEIVSSKSKNKNKSKKR